MTTPAISNLVRFLDKLEGVDTPEPAFIIPDTSIPARLDPRLIADRLVTDEERFSHLRYGEALIMFLFRTVPKLKGNKKVLGYIALPRFGGALADLGAWLLETACQGLWPDYIMILDKEFWDEATDLQREALVFHELCHTVHETDKDGEHRFDNDGRPVFGLQAHDLEEFNDVVKKYGAWLPDIKAFADALRQGGAA